MTPAKPALAENISWERMIRAVELVRERLVRSTGALANAAVPYAVIGGNAVMAWVNTIDPAATRNTPDVNLLVSREHFAAARATLENAGFVHDSASDAPVFLDAPGAKRHSCVRLLFACEKVRPADLLPTPGMSDAVVLEGMRIVSLQALVGMKLTAFRTIDRVHLRDMAGIGLIDATWPARFQPDLAARLQQILDTPGG